MSQQYIQLDCACLYNWKIENMSDVDQTALHTKLLSLSRENISKHGQKRITNDAFLGRTAVEKVLEVLNVLSLKGTVMEDNGIIYIIGQDAQ